MSSPLKIKVSCEGDTRLWRFPEKRRFESLVDFVCSKFGFRDRSQFVLQCIDEEDDHITIGTESDFEESYDSMVDEKKKTWKIYVVPRADKDVADVPRSESVDFDFVDAESVMSLSAEITAPVAEEKEEAVEEEVEAEPVEDIYVDDAVKDTDEEESAPKESGEDFKANALDYLMNENVSTLLPEFVREVLRALRATSTTVADAWQNVIAQERFVPLIAHPFYTDYAVEMLPKLFAKAQPFVPMVTTLNEDMIVSFIPRAIGIAVEAISAGFESFDCSTMLPPWLLFLNPEMAAAEEAPPAPPSTVHKGITCDGCGVSPIDGVRYKCAVCADYDLCETCEAGDVGHDKTHPMIKMPVVVDAEEFDGFVEQARRWGVGVRSPRCRRGRGRRGFGGRCHGRRGRKHGRGRRGCVPAHAHPFAHFFQAMSGREGFEVRTDPVTGDTSLIVDVDAPSASKTEPSSSSADDTVADMARMSAKFIGDVNLLDGEKVECGSQVTKTWRLKNNGPSEWGAGVKLCFLRGNYKASAERSYDVDSVASGEAIDVSATINVPKKPGKFIVYFRLKNAAGEWFGDRVWCELIAVKDGEVSFDKSAKKVSKLEAKKAKLEAKIAKLDDKIDSLKDDEDASAIAIAEEPVAAAAAKAKPMCVCGGALEKGTPVSVYHFGARVSCDMCTKYVPTAKTIYHCGDVMAHEGGYDVCETCYSILEESLPAPITEEPAVEIECKPEVSGVSAAADAAAAAEPFDGFKFAEQGRAVMKMGFDDVETIKFLLTKHHGNADMVVHILLGLQ